MLFRNPKFEVIYRAAAGLVREPVAELRYNGGMPEVMTAAGPVLVDGLNSFLLQLTDTFDADGRPIFHGDILASDDGDIFEVIFYNGAFRAHHSEHDPWDLDNDFCSKVKVVGDVVRNAQLLIPNAPPQVLIEADARQKIARGEAPTVRGFKKS